MIRTLKRVDGPKLFQLMDREFPEESALLGGRPEEFQKVVRRYFRWDSQFVLGLLRLVGRPIIRILAVEADGELAGITMVTFPRGSGYISDVVVDPKFRRRGFARQLLEEGRRVARRAKRRFVVLDVLEQNTGARALYDSLGYRPLRARSQFILEPVPTTPAPAATSGIRPFAKTDAASLVAIVTRQTPSLVNDVAPTTEQMFIGSALANRMMNLEEAAWVIDRGHGAEAYVSANCSPVFEAGHLSAPVVGESVDPSLADTLVRTAIAWCAARKVPRVLTVVAEENPRGAAALEAAGFHHAFKLWTLYRTVD